MVVAPAAEQVLTPIAHASQVAAFADLKYPSLQVVTPADVQVFALVAHAVHAVSLAL